MGRGTRRNTGGWLLILSAVALVSSARADPGLDWLLLQQAADGSYGATGSLATAPQTTAEVLRAQLRLGEASGLAFDSGLGFLDGVAESNTEFLSRKIVVNADGPAPVQAWVSELAQNQGDDGGFGDRPGYAASVYDTAFAVEALGAAHEETLAQTAEAVGFLLQHQNGDGGWSDGANDSSVYLTALAMRAMLPLRTLYPGVGDALTRAQNFLLSQRGADGLWGEDFLSASALIALVPAVADLSLVADGVGALKAHQGADGSWDADPFTTALAVQALRALADRQAGQTQPQAGSISGYVALANSTEPIAGATVAITEVPGTAVLTNADGYYTLPGLPPGSYTVTATKAGFTSASVVTATQAGRVTVAGKLILDVLPQTGVVKGLVFDSATRAPLEGVQVSLAGPTGYSALTDASGAFEIGGVAPGAYTLTFQKAGYDPASGAATVTAGQTLSAQLGLNASGGYQDASPGPVSGRVVDGKSGQPIAGARFDLGGGLSAITGADGTFTVASVPRGAYTGSVQASGYQSQTFSLLFNPGASGELGTLTLFPSAPVQAPTTLTLHGLVVDGVSGAPIPGAQVALVETPGSATTGADGTFVLSGITLQSFTLSLTASGYAPASYGIQVGAYGDATVTLKLSPPGTGATQSALTGVVTDAATGQAVKGAQVAVAGTALSAITGEDGRYSLSGIGALAFTLNVSAVGYQQQSVPIQTSAYGNYTLDPKLQPVAADSFQIVSVTAQQTESGDNALAFFTARIASLLTAPADALVLGEVQDASGTAVAQVMPYASGTVTPTAQFSFAANETRELTVPWNTEQFPPGAYKLVLRVVEPGSISRANPTGNVLAENSAYTRVVASAAIRGGVSVDPPLTQAGLPTPIAFAGLVQNGGNVALAAGAYALTVVDPTNDTVVFSAEADGPALEVGQQATVDFGSWVPTASGNLEVRVVAKTAGVSGTLSAPLYVGDKASGTFTVDRNVVPEGTQTVRGSIAMQGVDTTHGSGTDPLFALVKTAVQRGGAYTAPNAIAWHQANRCLGCHIQSQSLLGLSSAIDKAPIDAASTQFLFNAIMTSQYADGALRIAYPEYAKTQTTLNLWSLAAWKDPAATFRVRLLAAKYLQKVKIRSGTQTYWTPDHASGWWNTVVAHTALTLKNYAGILRDAETLDLTQVEDYALGAAFSPGSTGALQDLAVAPDGTLYALLGNGVVNRLDPATGTATAVVTGLPSGTSGLAVAGDGTVFVTRTSNPTLLRITPDGVRTSWSVGGYLAGVAVAGDGNVYVSDYAGSRILEVSPAGTAQTVASGGLLNHPQGLLVDGDGNLLVANRYGYDILKVDGAGSVSIYANGLAYQPIRMALAGDGTIYVSAAQPYNNGGLIRIHPDGTGERVLQQDGVQLIAGAGQALYVGNTSKRTVQPLDLVPLDTSALADLRAELPYGVRYLLGNLHDNSSDNTVHAMRLIGLAESRDGITDPAMQTQIDDAVTYEATLLRGRQRMDGSWGRYVNYSGDPLVTAMVGIALEYTNPSAADPQIRKTIEYLLQTQRTDGSWNNVSNGLTTRLASTSFVMIFMPKALDRLGGIDVDLHLRLASNVALSNPTLPPTWTQPDPSGFTDYVWSLPGVTGAGRRVDFDLTLAGMALGEQRPVAESAYLGFKNSFVDQQMEVPLQVPVVRAASQLTLAVALDQTDYQANAPVQITSTVVNGGPTVASGQVVLAIRPAGSTTPLAELPAQTVTDLASMAQIALPASWGTGSTLAGDYEVDGKLFDPSGRLLSEGVVPFRIRAPAAVAGTGVSTDRPVYRSFDSVQIAGRASNVSANAVLAPTLAELRVQDPTGATVFFQSAEVNELMPGAHSDLGYTLHLKDAPTGSYPVTLTLKDRFTRTVLSTSTTSFQVERDAVQVLAGSVAVDAAQVYQGDPDRCVESTRNLSATAVSGVTLIHRVLNADTGAVVRDTEETVDLPASGEAPAFADAIATDPLPVGGYSCILMAQVGGATRTLAFAGFRVLEPPIRFTAALSLGGRGRLLILLDGQGSGAKADDDPFGPEGAPGLHAQRGFLETALQKDGWSYTVTESADAFTGELHTGGYRLYALFAEREKLSEQVQQELREAVFRGEGLLVAGDHDARDNKLNDPLGVKFVGKLNDAVAWTPAAAASPLRGPVSLLSGEFPTRFERTEAQLLGSYQSQGGAEDGDAVVLNPYGRGASAYAGPDLLALSTQEGWASAGSDDLLTLLHLVHPAGVETQVGAVVPLQITITNQGIAVPVTVTLPIPQGVRVIDPGAGVVTGQSWSAQLDLAVGETRTLRLWLRLPDSPGALSLTASVSGTFKTRTFTVSTDMVLAVSGADTLAALRTQLDQLLPQDTADSVALKQARDAISQAITANGMDAQIRDVIRATDALLGITEPRVVDLRGGLDGWLRWELAQP